MIFLSTYTLYVYVVVIIKKIKPIGLNKQPTKKSKNIECTYIVLLFYRRQLIFFLFKK